ncbi:peptidyl-prolyl cis-trans isomerase G-like [Osmia bicornis bicornis]|uniref:peptidyl-prolyl cis-trans isomerase G-like n=1 Tax=Osmia bicornis bicornis TaxID=1437191 RepID=UPI001EAE8C96|nr:peptidyl-prolyl cis-trans isomerase G-like [Osmia bicornis bicornis]
MRRTRYVALPVRAWQYVGLLVVSLACLTLGLVSRDKEGRAGSLAGPEMEHQAPHKVDACPNWSPFTELPSALKPDQDQSRILKMSRESRNIRTILVPSRSRNVDHVIRGRFQMRTDFRSAEREERNVASHFSGRSLEFRLGTRNQDRSFRRSSDPAIRFSPTMDDLTNRRVYKRSTDMERRRTNEASRQRRFLTVTRSIERVERVERVARERNNVRQDERSLRNVEARSRMRSMVRRDSRLDQDRRSFARSEERRERVSRSNERRDSNSPRSLKGSRIDDSERRERGNQFQLVREKRESETPTTNSEELKGGRVTNRRSVSTSRRTSERSSASLESRNREEIRADRRSKERRSDRRVVEERFNHRSTEQKQHDRRLSERRSERRSTEQRTADHHRRRRVEERFDRRRRPVEQRFNHRSTEQRSDRRLPEQRSDRRNVEQIEQIEQRFNHRSAEQRSDRRLPEERSDRRLMEQRFNQRSTESGFDRRLPEKKLNRRLAEHRSDRRRHRLPVHEFDRRSTEEKFHRHRTEERLDRRNFDSRRLILQRYDDANRVQRTRSMPQISLRFSEKEDRLTDQIPVTDNNFPSYSIQRTTSSDDSTAFRSHARSSREKLLNRNNGILSRTNLFAASDILKQKNSMKYALTFEIIRQALVVALCIIYSLSLFRGKRGSIVSNLVRQPPPRFILW